MRVAPRTIRPGHDVKVMSGIFYFQNDFPDVFRQTKLYVLRNLFISGGEHYEKMRNFLTLAAAAALTGILLTGCSTEADETTIAKAETTTQTESAADAEKASEGDVSSEVAAKAADGSALAGKKISVMTPYLTSVTTNQMTGFIKDNLEAEGAEVFVIDTANDFAELASRIEDVVSSGTDGIVFSKR